MTTADPLQSLDQFVGSAPAPTANMAVGLAIAPPAFFRVNVQQDVANGFRASVQEFTRGLLQSASKPYSPGYKPESHELLTVSFDDGDQIDTVVKALASLGNVPILQEQQDVIDHIRFYVFSLQRGEKQAIFFRRATRAFELKKKYPQALAFNGDVYSRIEEKVLLFDSNFDCFTWDKVLYIKNVGNSQEIFGYYEELVKNANQTLDAALKLFP